MVNVTAFLSLILKGIPFLINSPFQMASLVSLTHRFPNSSSTSLFWLARSHPCLVGVFRSQPPLPKPLTEKHQPETAGNEPALLVLINLFFFYYFLLCNLQCSKFVAVEILGA